MTPSPRPACRPLVRLWGLLFAACSGAALPVVAAAQQAEPPALEIKRIYVPEDKPSQWLKDPWKPVPADEFQRLLEAAQPAPPGPPPVRIERAEYLAVLHENELRDGSLNWTVVNSAESRELLALNPLSLSITQLKWDAAQAVWGTAPDHRTALLADPGTAVAQGRWTLRGKSGSGGTEFDVQIAPAAVSEFRLLLPDDRVLRSSAGIVSGPAESEFEGRSLWSINLGSRTSCRLTVAAADAARKDAQQPPVILASSDISCVIRDEGLQIQTRLDLEVPEGAVDTLNFLVPPGVEVFSVTYGGKANLPWSAETSERQTRVDIRLPVPLRGRSHPIRIQAVAPVLLHDDWTLPLPRLDDAVFISGQVHLKIHRPLELKTFQAPNCRQTGMVSDAEGETFTFQQDYDDAEISVLVDYAEARLSASNITYLTLESPNRSFKSQFFWSARSGSTFRTEYLIHAGWDVTSVGVRNESAPRERVDWETKPAGQSKRLLIVNFRDPLDPQHPRTIEIEGRQRSPVAGATIELPVVELLHSSTLERVIVVSQAPAEFVELNPGGTFRAVQADDLPEFVRQSSLWRDVEARDPSELLLLRSDGFESYATLSISAPGGAGGTTNQKESKPPAPPGSRDNVLPTPPNKTRKKVDAASLELQTTFAIDGGSDVHRARFNVERAPQTDAFSFQLSEHAQLVSVEVDGRIAHRFRRGGQWSVPLGRGERRNVVEIQYRTHGAAGLFRQSRRVVLPRPACAVAGFVWKFALPQGVLPVEQPESGVLRTPLAGIPRTERFFGPLGRSESGGVFNPFALTSWRAMFSAPRTPDAAPQKGAPAFAPQNWIVRELTAPSPPQRLTLHTWDESRTANLAWILTLGFLIAGLTIKRSHVRVPSWLVAAWLAFCIAAAWQLPAHYAVVLGGCLTGTVLALLVPAKLLRPLRSNRETADAIPAGSTQNYAHAQPQAWLILSALWLGLGATSVVAQPSQTGESRTVPSAERGSEFSILVPVDSRLKPSEKLRVIYATPDLIEHLQRAARRHRKPEYLIASAEYEVNLRSPNAAMLEARYVVATLGGQSVTRVTLPITGGAHLGGSDACLVNGKPQPVLPADDGSGFVVELTSTAALPPTDSGESPPAASNGRAGPHSNQAEDAETPPNAPADPQPATPLQTAQPPVKTYEIVLRLHPPVLSQRGGGSFEVEIPPLAASRIAVNADKEIPPVAVFDRRGELITSVDDETPAGLPGADAFRVVWPSNEQPAAPSAALDVSVHCSVDVQPSWLEYRYHVAYEVVSGAVDSVVWKLPRDFILRSVESPAFLRAVGSESDAETKRWAIEFSSAQTDDFAVEANFARPTRSRRGRIAVPACRLIDPEDSRASIDVLQNQLGILPMSGYELTSAGAASGDGVARISHEWFAISSKDDVNGPMPQFAYEIEGPAELQFDLARRAARREVVWQNSVAVVGKTQLAWTYKAEIEISDGGDVFQHQLAADPRLNIHSVSVLEGGAERLQRWTHIGDRLILYLRDKTTGVQNVAIAATMPIGNNEPAPLPRLHFENVDPLESELFVYRTAGAALTLLDADSLQPIQSANEPLPADGRQILVAGFRLAPESELPRIRVRPPVQQQRVDSLTMLGIHPDNVCEISTTLRFPGGATPARVHIPPRLADSFQVEPAAALQDVERAEDGSAVALLEPLLGEPQDFTVTIVAQTAIPTEGAWNVPTAAGQNVSGGDNLLVLPVSGTSIVADSSLTSVPIDDVPDWIAEIVGREMREREWKAFRTQALPWKLAVQPPDRPAGETRVSLAHTQVWVLPSHSVTGCTEIYVRPGSAAPLGLSCPQGMHVFALFVDGSAVQAVDADAAVHTIELAPATAPHAVVLFWSLDSAQVAASLSGTSFPLPQPLNVAVDRSLLSVVAPDASRLIARNGVRPIGPSAYAAARLQGMMRYVRAASNNEAGAAAPRLLATHLRDAMEKYAAAGQPADSEDSNAGGDAAFAEISAELERLTGAAGKRTGGTIETQDQAHASVLAQALLASADALDHSTLYGSPTIAAPGEPVAFWLIERSWIAWACGLLGFLFALPILHRFFRSRWGQALFERDGACLALLGIFWWLCLGPSVAGPLLLAATLIAAIRRRLAVESAAGGSAAQG